MSKKKGLGQDVGRSIQIMDKLLGSLDSFHKMPVKRGLNSNGILDDKFNKVVNEAKEKAYALSIAVEDLRDQVKGAKPASNKRFASQRVISNFLKLS
jgi:hypothetical protein